MPFNFRKMCPNHNQLVNYNRTAVKITILPRSSNRPLKFCLVIKEKIYEAAAAATLTFCRFIGQQTLLSSRHKTMFFLGKNFRQKFRQKAIPGIGRQRRKSVGKTAASLSGPGYFHKKSKSWNHYFRNRWQSLFNNSKEGRFMPLHQTGILFFPVIITQGVLEGLITPRFLVLMVIFTSRM